MDKTLKAWVVKVGEVIPSGCAGARALRAGQIALRLEAAGAVVTWFVSAFDHYKMQYVGQAERDTGFSKTISLQYLQGRLYSKNVSLARVKNHLDIAKDFAAKARQLPRPDVIFCCYPTVELAYEAVRFGKEFDIPVVVDVRDMWPDIFEDMMPVPRWLSRLIFSPMTAKARFALHEATMVTAITEPFLEWAMQLGRRPRRPLDRAVHLAYQRRDFIDAEIADAESFWRAQGLALDGSENIACFFANLSHVPEFDKLIAALDHLPPDAKASFRLVICGSGPRLQDLQDQAARHAPNLVVPGFVNQAAMVSLMRRSFAGLVAYPARRDFSMSYPNKFGEYLSEGLPILLTFPGLAAGLLASQQCGIALPSADPASLAQAFATMIASKEGRQAARDRALTVFSREFNADVVYGGLAATLLDLARQNSIKVASVPSL